MSVIPAMEDANKSVLIPLDHIPVLAEKAIHWMKMASDALVGTDVVLVSDCSTC